MGVSKALSVFSLYPTGTPESVTPSVAFPHFLNTSYRIFIFYYGRIIPQKSPYFKGNLQKKTPPVHFRVFTQSDRIPSSIFVSNAKGVPFLTRHAFHIKNHSQSSQQSFMQSKMLTVPLPMHDSRRFSLFSAERQESQSTHPVQNQKQLKQDSSTQSKHSVMQALQVSGDKHPKQ